MINIIPAKKEHINELVLLNSEVQEIHSRTYPHIFKYPIDTSLVRDEFLSNISDSNQLIYVAVKENSIVGYIWSQYIERPESALTYAAKKIYIHHISVSQQQRKEGVGELLMAHISKEARQRSVQHIALDVWSFNESAASFFEKCGYEVFNVKMWKCE